MSESAPREWRFYIADMIGFSKKVLAYTDGMDGRLMAVGVFSEACAA